MTRRKLSEFNEVLTCILSPREVDEMRKLALEHFDAIEKVKLDLEHVKSRYTTRIKELSAKFRSAMNSAHSGKEDREVVVEEWLTPHGTVERVRIDTGEVLRTRPASAAELNEFIPGTEPDPRAVGERQAAPKRKKKGGEGAPQTSSDEEWG